MSQKMNTGAISVLKLPLNPNQLTSKMNGVPVNCNKSVCFLVIFVLLLMV